MKRFIFTFMLACLACAPCMALILDQPLEDKQLEQRAQSLFHQLRCIVCQGQPLADSDADLALSLRQLIREQLTQGRSDQEIVSELAASYGPGILITPPLEENTVALWLAPLLILLAGGMLVFGHLRHRHG